MDLIKAIYKISDHAQKAKFDYPCEARDYMAFGVLLANDTEFERVSKWHHCREVISAQWNKLVAHRHPFDENPNLNPFNAYTDFFLLYSFPNSEHERMAAFICEAEERLQVPLADRVKFFTFECAKGKPESLQEEEMLLVKFSSWWTESELRRQFFTLLLRAASPKVFEGQPFEYRLRQVPMIEKTWPAVEKFLNGYTYLDPSTQIIQEEYSYALKKVVSFEAPACVGGYNGWVRTFLDKDKVIVNVDKLLKEKPQTA